MRYKDIKNSEIDYFHQVYKDTETRLEAQEIISKKFNIGMRTVRTWAKDLGIIEETDVDKIIVAAKKKELVSSKYYMFTLAQSKTPVHENFFKYMKQYAEYRGAEIAVIAGRYSNPENIFNWNDSDPTWDEVVTPYLTLNRHKIHKNLSILADVKLLPTAAMPMSGFEGFESEVSIIIGHPRVQMKIVPTLEGYRKKEIFTTGACTVMNYRDSKVGKKGEFHHTLGFVFVEIDGDEVYIRHVTACDDGSFIDLDTEVSERGVEIGDKVVMYACGDKHFGETDPEMEQAGRDVMRVLKPQYVRLDDTFNGHSVNPHEEKDPIQKFKRFQAGQTILDYELDVLKKSLGWYNEQPFKVVIPRCNHDIFLDRYIASQDWKKDIPNALTYMRCTTILLEGSAPKGLIPYFISKWYPDMITLLNDESFRISEWEHAVHGHMGANGSKGSVIQFKKLSTKMFTAHTHSASRYDGVITVGTNTYLRVGFNQGPSSWVHCDGISQKNGKGQQLLFHNYKCTTLL